MYDNDYGTGALLAFWIVLLPLLFLFFIAGYVIGSFFLMKIFEKAGVQGKWRAWVPVYNLMVFAKLGDLSPWVMLGAIVASSVLGQIPGIGFIFSLVGLAAIVLAGWRVGLKLGKDWPYLLLWLIPGIGGLIWLGILAFSHSTWNPNIARAAWADSFLKDTVVWDGVPVQPGAPVGQGAAGAPAPAGYAPPAGYQPPTAYTPPPAAPAAPAAPVTPPPAAAQPPVTPPAAQPPVAPPAATEPPAWQPPASNEPPAAPDAPRP